LSTQVILNILFCVPITTSYSFSDWSKHFIPICFSTRFYIYSIFYASYPRLSFICTYFYSVQLMSNYFTLFLLPCYFTYDDIAKFSYYLPSARSSGRRGPFPVHCLLHSSRPPRPSAGRSSSQPEPASILPRLTRHCRAIHGVCGGN
jgi:hypothetical protein